MSIVLNGLEWDTLHLCLPLDETKEAVAEAGWRLPTLAELHAAYGIIDADNIDSNKTLEWQNVLKVLNTWRTWAADECVGVWNVDPKDLTSQFNGQPLGFQFIALQGTTWPTPAHLRLTSFMVREA